MTIHVSYAVMSHPIRRRLAEHVLAFLPKRDAIIVDDPCPFDPPATLRTSRLSWMSFASEATHHVVLQDDVEPCPYFADHVAAIAQACPDAVVALFTSWWSRNGGFVRLGAARGDRLVYGIPEYVPTPALLMPRSTIENFLDFISSWQDPTEADDDVLQKFLESTNIPLLLSVPNLVQHLGVRSSVGNDSGGSREAAIFIGNLPSTYFQSPLGAGLYREVACLYQGHAMMYIPDCQYVFESPPTFRNKWQDIYLEQDSSRVMSTNDDLLRLYNDDLSNISISSVRRMMQLVPASALWSLWLYSLWLGQQTRAIGSDKLLPAVGSSVHHAMISAALDSMIIGGLFPLADEADLKLMLNEFRKIVDLGYSRGLTQSYEVSAACGLAQGIPHLNTAISNSAHDKQSFAIAHSTCFRSKSQEHTSKGL